MKILFLLTILAIILFTNNSIAQSNSNDLRDKLSFGLKIGTNYSNVYDTEGEEFNADAKFGFAAGAFISIPIGQYIGIQPELLFSQKGFTGSGSLIGGKYKFTRTSNYIDIPILVAFKPIEYLTILAGPQYSYLFEQKDEFDNPISDFEIVKEFENDNFRKNTLCFVAGADGYLDQFVFGVRVGFDLFNNNGDGTSTTPRYKNVWLQITAGIRF